MTVAAHTWKMPTTYCRPEHVDSPTYRGRVDRRVQRQLAEAVNADGEVIVGPIRCHVTPVWAITGLCDRGHERTSLQPEPDARLVLLGLGVAGPMPRPTLYELVYEADTVPRQ